jgi:hypothetical protein
VIATLDVEDGQFAAPQRGDEPDQRQRAIAGAGAVRLLGASGSPSSWRA